MSCTSSNSYFQHRKHEQDQHDKEISDLVHGIAAGNLWKRRNGQIDDLDLFDEEDMDGRFRRKKKLKVSEKFEMLGKLLFGHLVYSGNILFEDDRLCPFIPNPALYLFAQFYNSRPPEHSGICEGFQKEHG